jgi:LacI family transcriptional regulator
MKDIAQRLGVSRSTVSLVLNRRDAPGVRIPVHTRERILAEAESMGYRRNELARAVVTGRNPVFAFLVPAPEVEVAARLLAGALDEAEARGHTVQVVRLPGGGADDEARAIHRCVEMRPVGVMSVYVHGARLDHLHEEMGRYHIPVAVLDSSFPQARGLRIVSDDFLGSRQAVEHLTGLGHRCIAFFGGDPNSGASAMRQQGFVRAMTEAGLEVPEGYVRHGDWHPEKIDRITREAFGPDAAPAPTAVFCADDKTAMVVCRTLRRLGRRVPEDISVVGFADLSTAAFNDPPLTTVAQPFHEIGRAAVARLIVASEPAEGEAPQEAPREEWLPTRLIVRESTAAVAR